MNRLGIDDIREDKYSVTVSDRDQTIHIQFSGVIDSKHPGKTLNPFFLAVDEAVGTAHIKTVFCSIEYLTFINSRGIKSFLNWIVHITAKPFFEQYKIIFILDDGEQWQKRALADTLKLYLSVASFEYR
jgi:hypothetical protein